MTTEDNDNSGQQFIGLKLKEVKILWSTVRVMGINGQGQVGTMDYNPGRLNVYLKNVEEKGVTTHKIGDREYKFPEYGDLDEGIVESVRWG